MKKPHLLSVMCVLLTTSLLASKPTYSATVLDTASGPNDMGSAIGLSDNYWVLHRFEITTETNIKLVGGYFGNDTAISQSIFAAIISLSDSSDLPNSIDLSTTDVIDTTLITVGTTNSLYLGNLDLVLSPGWYALEFGSNAFGASSLPGVLALTMPDHAIDLSPSDYPITATQPGSFNPNQFILQGINARFVITDTVPIPPALYLFGSGLLGLIGTARRKQAS